MSCADADFLDESEKSFPTKFGNTTLPEIEAGNQYTRNLLAHLAQIDELIADNEKLSAQKYELLSALEKLAKLGNGNTYGNSVGNCIAKDAIDIVTGEKISNEFVCASFVKAGNEFTRRNLARIKELESDNDKLKDRMVAMLEQKRDLLASLNGCRRAIQKGNEVSERMEKKLREEIKHWKSNHANEVRRARILKERPDLPIDRVKAYEQWGKDQAKIGQLQARIDELMLEYCPEEMTTEQLEEWSKHQVRESVCPSCGRSWDEHEFTVPLACPIKETK